VGKSEYALKRLAEIAGAPARTHPTLPAPVEPERDYMPRCGVPFRRPEYMKVIARPGGPFHFRITGYAPWKRPLRVLPKDQLRGMGNDVRGSGIYFLWFGAELVYVGQSVDVQGRLRRHKDCWDGRVPGKAMQFTRATSVRCSPETLTEIEYEYICTYGPPFNDKWSP
jgi:hypothetical protein